MGKGNKPATMPIAVPVLRVREACRGERTQGPLLLRPVSGKPIDRRDVYRMVLRVAKAAGIPRHVSPHSLRHAAITNALDAIVPLRNAQILARHPDPAPPSTTTVGEATPTATASTSSPPTSPAADPRPSRPERRSPSRGRGDAGRQDPCVASMSGVERDA
jgi:integrase